MVKENLVKFYLGILILLALPIVTAVELSNTAIISTGLNLTINITTPSLFADVIQVEDSFIYFQGLRASAGATDKITINITEQNKSYFGTDLPYFFSSTATNKHIASNITSLNGTLSTWVTDCSTAGTMKYYPKNASYYLTYLDGSYTCSNGVATITNVLINPSPNSNIWEITYDGIQSELCSDTLNGLGDFGVWFGIIIIVAIAGGIIFLMYGDTSGISEANDMSTIIIIAAIVISLGAIIIANVLGNLC
jgi:hypothetical protein